MPQDVCAMRILIVLTSPEKLPTGERIGFQLEDFALAYYGFGDLGMEVVIASSQGGEPFYLRNTSPPVPLIERFQADQAARISLSDTLRLDQIHADDFAALFCLGEQDDSAGDLVGHFRKLGKPVALTSPDGTLYVERDDVLVTGQNTASIPAAVQLIGRMLMSKSLP
ncbi:hypothetical protein ACFSM5_19360 [Lacibacterium aquatile]|uniref:DJ-1/PfpI domain-containing protein n=1 Tax=Lacibacterium aquatile TaxID=1168082 RepID=A0ABW5E081_9PROT